jgi:hypothetical protein
MITGVACLALGVAACGGEEQRAEQPADVAQAQAAPPRVERTPDNERAGTAGSSTRRRAQTPASTPRTRPRAVVTACDANISIKAATTTCEFGHNAFWMYWHEQSGAPMAVWSPSAQAHFATTCLGSERIVCRAEDGGQVRFSASAVRLYDADQAARYAASHDVGPRADLASADPALEDELPEGSYEAPEDGSSEPYDDVGSDPVQMQEDAVGDLDCGDFAMTDFEPIAGDPHGLDADFDGVACES